MGMSILNVLSDGIDSNIIPSRDPATGGGSKFIQNNISLIGDARENNILHEFIGGNIPDFMRKFVPITVSNSNYSLTYLVMPDYLCIGSNTDYVRVPMDALTAQKIATKFDCSLPTKKMVKDIWAKSPNKLKPLLWGPPYDNDMQKTHRIATHNQRIQEQLINKDPFILTSGHKKDVVLTNLLAPSNPKKRVAIYGWIREDGNPVQGLNAVDHALKYVDYSHGIRLIANDIMVNEKPTRLDRAFQDPNLIDLISDEGLLKFIKY